MPVPRRAPAASDAWRAFAAVSIAATGQRPLTAAGVLRDVDGVLRDGEQQVPSIARSLLINPRLRLDEPNEKLSPRIIDEILAPS